MNTNSKRPGMSDASNDVLKEFCESIGQVTEVKTQVESYNFVTFKPQDLAATVIKELNNQDLKIPHDLYPGLPSKEFVMSELLDDAIGIYHRMFNFSGVRIPFSSFLLALIKHYKVHFSQLGPMGLNKGDWLLFAKRCAPSPVCIDDNCSYMKHWKSGVPMEMWTGAEVQEEPYLDVRPNLQRLPFYCTPPDAAGVVIPDPTLEDLAMGTPSSKILAKAEASQKQKASTSGATSSHVSKRTRSAMAQSSGSTTRPSLFMDNSDDGSDDDDDACVRIPLVTPIRSATVIPSSGNQGGSSAIPAAKGLGTRDSRGKGIMADDVVAPSVGVSRPRPSSRPAPSFRDISEDAIHMDFFPFSNSPYYATYPEGGVTDNCEFTHEEWDAPYRPTFRVLTKEVFKDPAMSVLHCMMISHGGELLACYHGLNYSHREYVLSSDSKSEDYEEKVASLTGLKLQVSTLKKQVFGLNDKLSSSDASFAKSKAKGKERKKKIKSLTKSLDNLHAEVARLSDDLNQATGLIQKFLASDEFSRVQGELLSLVASVGFKRGLSMHRTKDEFAAMLKKMAHFMPVRSANIPTSRDARISPPITKESIVTSDSESLELSANVVPAPFAVAYEQNEEWVNAMVDGSDVEMTDGVAHSKSEGVFVQGTYHVLDDVAEVTVVG
ncbi:integrase, catalytic region, zinc finger, CCHC-type containing protein [Tanacetum coccineum]